MPQYFETIEKVYAEVAEENNAYLFTATITGEIPETIRTNYTCLDIEGESIRLMILDKLDVIFCQEIAKDIMLKHWYSILIAFKSKPHNVK